MSYASVLGEHDFGPLADFFPGFFGKNAPNKHAQREESYREKYVIPYPACVVDKRPDNKAQSNQAQRPDSMAQNCRPIVNGYKKIFVAFYRLQCKQETRNSDRQPAKNVYEKCQKNVPAKTKRADCLRLHITKPIRFLINPTFFADFHRPIPFLGLIC